MKLVKDFLEERFNEDIEARITLSPVEGRFKEIPDSLNSELKNYLSDQEIDRLYSHQHEAFESITKKNDTLLVSKTASGKTLSFFLPIFNDYMNCGSPFSTLLLYPTRALSRDQESTFGGLMKVAGKSNKLGTFDGDTPAEERERLVKSADFIISNPDMLHSGILPNHSRRWKSFLSRLKYIVIDEVHIYRGAFGSHVANVLRRLLRVCEMHGARPVFICCSATVGNPSEHSEALTGRKFNIIDRDGAPQGKKEIYFINPALFTGAGDSMFRKGPSSVSIPVLRYAAKKGIRSICFCRSRQEVERLYRSVIDGFPDLRNKVKPYRGGLLPKERRQLERDLSSGKITSIITTNALELGIDIGDLDLCILSGHPGSIASFWQQSGRVGRKGKSSLSLFIAKEKTIDQYLVHHPDFITGTPVEEALVNSDNPYIFLQHLPCAAREHPLRKEEPYFNSILYEETLEVLIKKNVLKPYQEQWRYSQKDYPSRGVNLRGLTDYNVEIYCGTEVIGELDPIGARGTLYKDAIYHHLGRRYMSMELDLAKKLCRVEPVDVDYYTEAVWEGCVSMVEACESNCLNGAVIENGIVNVNRQPKLYKKIRERSYENIGYGPITLDPFEYDTTGFSILPPEEWIIKLEQKDKRYVTSAMAGLSYLLRHTAPLICMSDVKDIHSDVAPASTGRDDWKNAIYLYDSIEGGVGYAEKIFDKIEESLGLCTKVLDECECSSGCPACIPPLPPGVESLEDEEFLSETDAAVQCTRSLLKVLLSGIIEIPEIQKKLTPVKKRPDKPEPDHERLAMRAKLSRAADIYERKKERLH